MADPREQAGLPQTRKEGLQGIYLGDPVVQADVIKRLSESLVFAVKHDRPGAFIVAGPPRVGKTSVIKALETTLVENGINPSFRASMEMPPYMVYANIFPGQEPEFDRVGTFLYSEIAVQERKQLETVAQQLSRGKRVVLDVINKEYPVGDPRNNLQAGKILVDIFPHKQLHLRQLYAIPKEYAVPARVPIRETQGMLDLSLKPEALPYLAEHKRIVDTTVKLGVFVPGDTYIADGMLITELVYTGMPTFGSIDGQRIETTIPKELL